MKIYLLLLVIQKLIKMFGAVKVVTRLVCELLYSSAISMSYEPNVLMEH